MCVCVVRSLSAVQRSLLNIYIYNFMFHIRKSRITDVVRMQTTKCVSATQIVLN